MLKTSRQRIANQAPVYLMWGILVLASSLTHFVLLMFTDASHPYLVWPVLMSIGGILTPILLKKYVITNDVVTYSDRMMSSIYIGSIVLMALLLLIGIQNTWQIAFPLFMALYGYTSFMAGDALRFRPLKIGGLFSMILAIAALFVEYQWQILCIGASTLSSYLLPDFMLMKSDT